MTRQILLCLMVFLAMRAHKINQVEGHSEVISTFVSVSKKLSIPYSKCFNMYTEPSTNDNYLTFKPSSLALKMLIRKPIQNSRNISIVDKLRTASEFLYENILVLDDFMILISFDKKVVTFKETLNSFQKIKQFSLQQLDPRSQYSLFEFNNQGFLKILNSNRALLIKEKSYSIVTLTNQHAFIKLRQIPETEEFLTAQLNSGVGHYKMMKKENGELFTEEVGRFDEQQLYVTSGRSAYTTDINLNHYTKQQPIVYALDARNGVYKFNLKQEHNSKYGVDVLFEQLGCISFDSLPVSNHFVLVCINEGMNKLIPFYLQQNGYANSAEPIYFKNYFTDIKITEKYYLLISRNKMRVYWNTKANKLPEMLQTGSNIDLEGLQSLFIRPSSNSLDNLYLYTIESGELAKYHLKESQAELKIKAEQEIHKNFAIFLEGSCIHLDSAFPSKLREKVETCRIRKEIDFSAYIEQGARDEDYSFGAFIVIILMLIMLILIWICLSKYKGLEKKARKVLDGYKKKKHAQHRAI